MGQSARPWPVHWGCVCVCMCVCSGGTLPPPRSWDPLSPSPKVPEPLASGLALQTPTGPHTRLASSSASVALGSTVTFPSSAASSQCVWMPGRTVRWRYEGRVGKGTEGQQGHCRAWSVPKRTPEGPTGVCPRGPRSANTCYHSLSTHFCPLPLLAPSPINVCRLSIPHPSPHLCFWFRLEPRATSSSVRAASTD